MNLQKAFFEIINEMKGVEKTQEESLTAYFSIIDSQISKVVGSFGTPEETEEAFEKIKEIIHGVREINYNVETEAINDYIQFAIEKTQTNNIEEVPPEEPEEKEEDAVGESETASPDEHVVPPPPPEIEALPEETPKEVI